ncbi:MAG: cysteine rich repeat-containing protein [Bdellovibrionia bacterium]
MKVRLGILTLLFSSLAFAQGGPCAADMQKLCSGKMGPKGGGMKCLMEQKESLSAECREHIEGAKEKMKGAIKDIAAACEADRDKFCKDVPGGKGRIMKCLKENESQVSAECKAELSDKRAAFKMNKQMRRQMMEKQKELQNAPAEGAPTEKQ